MWPGKRSAIGKINKHPCFFESTFALCIYLVSTIVLFLVLYLHIKEMSDKY